MLPVRDILLLVFIFGSLPVCFIRPFYGILLWTMFAFLNPHRFTWDSAQDFPLAFAVAMPTLIGFIFFSRSWKQLLTREVFLLTILWGWFVFTALASSHAPVFAHHAENTWERLELVSKILLMTVVTIGIVDNRSRLRSFLLVIAGSFGFLILKSLPFIIQTSGEYRIYGPDKSMLADNNDFGLALNMTLPIFFFLAKTESKRWLKWTLGFLFCVSIPVIFFTYSRGAIVGLAAILLLMILQMKQRFVLLPVLACALLIALFLAPDAWQQRMNLTAPGALDASARSRINAWTFSWRLAKDYPIMGGGFATFTKELYYRYAPNPNDVKGPHSIYFGVLAEHGFVGLFLYFSLILSCYFSLRSTKIIARVHGDTEIVSYSNMLWFSLIGFMVSGAFLGRAYFDYFFSIVACISILNRVAVSEMLVEYRTVLPEDYIQPIADPIISENRLVT